MLLRVHKRPEALEGSYSARSALRLTRLWVTVGLPFAWLIFLSPSLKNPGSIVPFITTGIGVAIVTAIVPDAIQRVLLCSGICLGKEKFDAEKEASSVDYYGAQQVWPASMKYHMTHPLYKTLPASINPENFS